MTLLSLSGLSVRLRGREVVSDVLLDVRAGEVVGLVGPNGAGKTTLLRAALGLVASSGRSSLHALPPARRARHAAWLPQERTLAWPMTVRAVVALGRIPHMPARGALAPEDRAAVDRALGRLDLAGLADRPADALSGGEVARVLMARVIAQETPLILADEPLAGLDPAHAIRLMDSFAALAAEGRAIVTSLHDLALAARMCSRVVLIDGGRIVGDGPPAEVLAAGPLARVFGIRARLDGTALQIDGLA